MEDGLSSEAIKVTQTLLGKHVKRPPLSEKLLKKPPFRFLHDIITTVHKTTGFFEGLFDGNELISDNVKDRDSKILFLNKVICVIGSTTGKTLTVKPSKIVAGQEPEKTNELLQCLAQALDDNLSSKEAIRNYKENKKSPQTKEHTLSKTNISKNLVNKLNNTKKVTSKATEKVTNREKDSYEQSVNTKEKHRNETKIKKKESGIIKNESQNTNLHQSKTGFRKTQVENKSKPINKPQFSSKTITPNTTKHEEIENTQMNYIENNKNETDQFKSGVNVNTHTDHNIPSNDTEVNLETFNFLENDLNTSQLSDELVQAVNSSTNNDNLIMHIGQQEPIKNDQSITSEYNKDNNVDLDENINEKSHHNNTIAVEDYNKPDNRADELEKINYSTESKTPEKIATSLKTASNQNIDRPFTVRPSSSRPGAPRPREKLENYLSDTDNILLGKVNIIAEHSQNEEEEDNSIIIMEQDNFITNHGVEDQLDLSSEHEHGHLVQQILNSQKVLNQVVGKTEIEWQFGAQRAKEAQNQEIDLLRYNIQALSRVANPLGKLLDHIQEDVEIMRQELQQWTNIYEEVYKEMVKQKTLNEGTLLPLHSKLKQIEEEIQEKYIKINDLKILIYKNSSRIEKLLVQ